ncbi:rod shape-determining protein RodA [Candidatus Contubernalis alkaliaceticus]|uniref:rod shape-determining protein RodA n=1 Tax=Candidatus Contubernalis alkaliaceticus TaxID=338645 RepID=UPI001F4C1055|nr:rod shape-determining protein RodA [Candidatus Contubernalis alkalaceticus]UNC90923.1 rod shape-determining protein RodA [Candidatus Contubernalis alkalaceticus]
MFDPKLWRNFDYLLLLTVIIISLYGLVVISSATSNFSADPWYYVQKQAIWIAAGLIGLFLVVCIDYSNFSRLSNYIYLINLGLLVLVMFIGRETAGSQRWIDLRFFDLQPSEVAKLAIIITLAKLLEQREGEMDNPKNLLLAFVHVAVPMYFIFKQPDLGTSLVFLAILFGMLFLGGAKIKHLLMTVIMGVGVGFPLLWLNLKPYQKMRLVIFLNPEQDPLHYGYQLIQSVIAIGSGRIWGKGLFEGTQNIYDFLPAQHTDFIFSVLGEELGFVGAVALLCLYLFLIYRILKVSSAAKDTFGLLLCVGVASMLVFQVLVNVGMAISIMPVTGLPLPFMSYGGSSFLVNMLSIGIVLNVGMRRHKIMF